MIELIKDHLEKDAPLKFDCKIQKSGFPRVISWSVSNKGPKTFVGTLRLKMDMPAKFDKPWIMVPGFFYGENRKEHGHRGKLCPRFDSRVTQPLKMVSSWWDFAADRMASPLMYLYQDQSCFALASDPHFKMSGKAVSGDPEPQVSVGFGHNGKTGYVRFSIPACEEPFTYTTQEDDKPTIRRVTLPPKSSVSGKLYLYEFEGDRHGYQRVIEHYNAMMKKNHPPAELQETFSLMDDAIYGIVDGHYHTEDNYFVYCRLYHPVHEQIANARAGVTLEWHQMNTGFVGGFLVCNSLHRAASFTGSQKARDAAIRVANKICQEGVSPSGFFWADYMLEKVKTQNGSFKNPLFKEGRKEWGNGWLPDKEWIHSRTISDACNHLMVMYLNEKKQDPQSSVLPIWKKALEGNFRAALDLQLANGSYGQFYNAVKKAIVKEDGCGGLLWISAMIKAIQGGIFDEKMTEEMKKSVIRAGDAYASYVESENIWGAPEDNDTPTSEDGLNAVTAYCDLYKFTKDKKYLKLAQIAADWMLTFRKTYNQIMPPNSLIGRYGMRSRGGDFASVSNNHFHVFEVLVTSQLCDLSRWTKNPYYADRARDHWAFVCQYLSRCDGMFNGFRGAMAEQFYWCNYGSWGNWKTPAYHRQKGAMAPATAVWCIAVLLLSAPDAHREFHKK